jgi:hypothetical protein
MLLSPLFWYFSKPVENPLFDLWLVAIILRWHEECSWRPDTVHQSTDFVRPSVESAPSIARPSREDKALHRTDVPLITRMIGVLREMIDA